MSSFTIALPLPRRALPEPPVLLRHDHPERLVRPGEPWLYQRLHRLPRRDLRWVPTGGCCCLPSSDVLAVSGLTSLFFHSNHSLYKPGFVVESIHSLFCRSTVHVLPPFRPHGGVFPLMWSDVVRKQVVRTP